MFRLEGVLRRKVGFTAGLKGLGYGRYTILMGFPIMGE